MDKNKNMEKDKKKCCTDCESFALWIKGPTFAIYLNYVLSAWGDWMWLFAAGLYLVYLAEGSLRLAAIFGFAGGTLMLVMGGIIGDWVDRNGRMKVVCISLFLQNMSVALCATAVCLTLVFHDHIYGGLNGYLSPLVEAAIIALALIAFLSSMAYKIAIEKDWIVVVAGGNTTKLTDLNAATRAIDLSCKILAPTIAGLVMSYSHIIAAILIAVWNVVSVVCEYLLLRRVYRLVPELAVKGGEKKETKEYEMKDLKGADIPEKEPLKTTQDADELDQGHPVIISNGKDVPTDMKMPLRSDQEDRANGSVPGSSESKVPRKEKKTCCQMVTRPFVTLAKGWKTYVTQKVVFAGLSLAFLYMTVLGFDYVTTGYIYTNGMKESYVGISMALAGITGIIGTFVFSALNKKLGLERTGLVAFFLEIACLTLTVASIWAPGSVYDPTFSKPKPNCTAVEKTTETFAHAVINNISALAVDDDANIRSKRDLTQLVHLQFDRDFDEFSLTKDNHVTRLPYGKDFPLVWTVLHSDWLHNLKTKGRKRRDILSEPLPRSEGSDPPVSAIRVDNEPNTPPANLGKLKPEGSTEGPEKCPEKTVTVSIILFLLGIITSRIGLWMADLVVTQLLQENVRESERGIVNGVQNSLNMLMDMIKNALVIVMPSIETFGTLILLSFFFICIGGGFFIGHVAKNEKAILTCQNPQDGGNRPVVVDEVDVEIADQKIEIA